MKRLLFLAVVAALAVAGSAVASTTLFSVSGSMKFGSPLVGSFTNPVSEPLTITLTVDAPKAGTSYLMQLQLKTPSGVVFADQTCIADVFAPATTGSCSIVSADPGTWTVYAHPRSGKYGAATGTITVTTP